MYTLPVVQVTCGSNVHIFIKALNFGTEAFSEMEPRGGHIAEYIVLALTS